MTRWPGLDGAVVLGSAAVVTGAWLVAADGMGGHWLALVLGLDLTWLLLTWWGRR